MSTHSKSAEARRPSRKEKRHSVAKRNVESSDSLSNKKDIKERFTIGLYSLKTSDSLYGLPFPGVSDSVAFTAAKEMLPSACLYRVGSFCLYDGSFIALSVPVLVSDNKDC